jgi:type III secretion protein D
VNAPFAPLMIGTMVLRVLSGRMQGAEHRLHNGKFVRIGHSLDHDIVLRDPSTRGLSFELHIGSDVATVRVVAGEVALLGRPVTAGEEASLPAFVPLAIGALSIAIGDPTSDRWGEAERLSTTMAPVTTTNAAPLETPHAGLAERLATRLYPLREGIAFERRWPLYGVLAAVVLMIAVLIGPATTWIGSQWHSRADDQAALAAAGFRGLTLSDGAAGQGPTIHGIVKDDAELSRLRAVVAERIGRATIDVDTMQAMAAAATDILRAQGIDGEAKPMRGTTLAVTGEYLPADRQVEVAAMIQRDVPGITQVTFTTEGARGERDLQYFFSNSAFGLATFVDGNPGYLVTADGTRWFAGAQVPTGHKIISIGNGRASFERDGRVEELILGAAPPPAPGAPPPPSGGTNERTQS